MKVSKFIKVDRNILVEYIYNDQNLIGESYKVLVNSEDNKMGFMSGDISSTNNTQDNSLFLLDLIDNRWGEVDTNQYNFLQNKDYSGGLPIRYDTIKVHFPINYTFNEFLGFNLKVYTLDFNNRDFYELSNYFFDVTDTSRMNQLGFSTPQLLFQEQLWGKNIEIQIPSPYTLGLQRDGTNATSNSINSNLTNAVGLSQNSPVIIDFHFLTKKDVINNITTYLASSTKTISFPQVPEFENLGVMIEDSPEGDFFEIYGIFNGTSSEFGRFIENSRRLGKRYYAQYEVTMFEENLRGKSSVYTVTDNFSEAIEFRPIIKFSSTTAVIDVEMKLIDQVDDSQISRKASYGMLSDEVAKYSLSLSRINVEDASKPKIYNLKNNIDISSGGLSLDELNSILGNRGGLEFQQVKVPYPVITDRGNIVAKSDNVKLGKDTWYGTGKLQILVYPFDNIFKFILAREIDQESAKIEYFDLSGSNNIQLVFKNSQLEVKVDLYTESGEVDLENGVILFKIGSKKIPDLRNIFISGINAFYLTTSFNDTTTILYSGTFKMYDSANNLNQLNAQRELEEDQNNNVPTEPSIIPDTSIREEAIVTRRRVLKNSKLKTAISPKNLGKFFRK